MCPLIWASSITNLINEVSLHKSSTSLALSKCSPAVYYRLSSGLHAKGDCGPQDKTLISFPNFWMTNKGKICIEVKKSIVNDGCLCLRFVGNSIFLKPRQNSHWFNLNISAATSVPVLQAVTQITYAGFFYHSFFSLGAHVCWMAMGIA